MTQVWKGNLLKKKDLFVLKYVRLGKEVHCSVLLEKLSLAMEILVDMKFHLESASASTLLTSLTLCWGSEPDDFDSLITHWAVLDLNARFVRRWTNSQLVTIYFASQP